MQLDRFTEKAQEAIVAAQQLAERLHSPVLDAEHLLPRSSSPTTASPPRRSGAWAWTWARSGASSRRCSPGAPGSRAAR